MNAIVLIGGAGADTIVGGSGRSILIGDKGPDQITAGSGDTILIGGSAEYDSSSLAQDLALESILAKWQSPNSYSRPDQPPQEGRRPQRLEHAGLGSDRPRRRQSQHAGRRRRE